jgi:hypothetical protein
VLDDTLKTARMVHRLTLGVGVGALAFAFAFEKPVAREPSGVGARAIL